MLAPVPSKQLRRLAQAYEAFTASAFAAAIAFTVMSPVGTSPLSTVALRLTAPAGAALATALLMVVGVMAVASLILFYVGGRAARKVFAALKLMDPTYEGAEKSVAWVRRAVLISALVVLYYITLILAPSILLTGGLTLLVALSIVYLILLAVVSIALSMVIIGVAVGTYNVIASRNPYNCYKALKYMVIAASVILIPVINFAAPYLLHKLAKLLKTLAETSPVTA